MRDRLPLPKLQQLYDYWEGKRGGRRWPKRSAVDPVEMRFALGNIDLVEISYDPIVFLFRISGSNIDRDEGFNMQGKTLDEYPLPQHRETVRKTYMRVLDRGEPDYEVLERLDEGQVTHYGRMILPLSENGDRIDGFLMARYELKSPNDTEGEAGT
jgi:hypothetical protein